jgi:hypothetical protein
MKQVSLTTFVDFVQSSGMQRVTEIKKAIRRSKSKSSGKGDYYMPVRSKLVSALKLGKCLDDLSLYSTTIAPVERRHNYSGCVSGLVSFFNTSNARWCNNISGKWLAGDLAVNVSPELGLLINDKKYAVRVYFRKNGLENIGLDSTFSLINYIISNGNDEYKPAILDARSGALHTERKIASQFNSLLESEAAAMLTLWDKFEKAE